MRDRVLIISAVALFGALVFLPIRSVRTGAQLQAAAKPQASTPDFSGIWLGRGIQSLSLSDPGAKKPAGTEPDIPYQPWALAKVKAQKPATGPNQTFENTDDPALKYADPDGYPRALIHPWRFKIVQTPDSMYILFEYNQSWRPIAMNREHSKDPDATWFGEAVGKWEGDTLVVDAIGFNDRPWLDPIGHPRTEKFHLVEHWRRVDHETLVDELLIDDPGAYTKPWPSKLTFKLDHSGDLRESIFTISDELRFRKDIINPTKKATSK
jgi:hypothetical protein